MVKGISKQVIVVKTPVSGIFDQAIFILGDNAGSSACVDAENILSEACAIADDYVQTHCAPMHKSRKTFLVTVLSSSLITLILTCLVFAFLL